MTLTTNDLVGYLRAEFAKASKLRVLKRFGARILPSGFDKKSYMEAPKWPRSGNMAVTVQADLHRSKMSTQKVRAISSLEPVQPGNYVHFRAVTGAG